MNRPLTTYTLYTPDSCSFLWILHKSTSISCLETGGWGHVKLIAYNVQLCSVLSNKGREPFVCLDHHRCCTLHGMPGQGLIFCWLINHHKEGSKLHTTLVVNLITRRSDCQMASVWGRDDKYWPAAERQGPVLGRTSWSILTILLVCKEEKMDAGKGWRSEMLTGGTSASEPRAWLSRIVYSMAR